MDLDTDQEQLLARLEPVRQRVAARQLEFETFVSRWFGAFDDLRRSDYFVCVLDSRYGWRFESAGGRDANPERLSITEMEIREVLQRNLPRVFLVRHPEHLVASTKIGEQPEDGEALAALKQRLIDGGERVVFWHDVEELLVGVEQEVQALLDADYPPGEMVPLVEAPRETTVDEANSPLIIQEFVGHTKSVNFAAYSPDGQRIASASADCSVRVWDVASGTLVHTFEGHEDHVYTAVFSPDGQRVVSASADGAVRVWDAVEGALIHTLKDRTGVFVYAACFSPDDRQQRIASAAEDLTVRLWDATNGKLVRLMQDHSDRVDAVAFSPDGRFIASGCSDKKVRIWDVESGTLLHTLEGHERSVTFVSFSPDGQRITSASWDKTLRVWDASRGELVQTLAGHHKRVTSVCYSPDGSRILSASSDENSVWVWDAASGKPLHILRLPRHGASKAFYSPDGQHIVVGSWDSTFRIWPAP